MKTKKLENLLNVGDFLESPTGRFYHCQHIGGVYDEKNEEVDIIYDFFTKKSHYRYNNKAILSRLEKGWKIIK